MAGIRDLWANPALMSALSAAAGALFWNFVSLYRSRVKTLEYTVRHDRVGVSADDAIFGNVAITWQGTPVESLYVSTVWVTNASSADYSNLKIKSYTGTETLLLTERTTTIGSTYRPLHTEEWKQEVAVATGVAPTPAQFHAYYHSREYDVAVFNRNERIELTYLTTVHGSGGPSVWLDSLHEGAKLLYRPAEQQFFGVPVKLALPIGWFTCLVVVVVVSVTVRWVWLAAGLSMVAGLAVQTMGAMLYRVFRFVKHILFR